MGKLGVRARILLISVGLIACAVGVAYVYLRASLDDLLHAQAGRELAARAALVEDRVSAASLGTLRPSLAWQRLADDLAASAHARITIVSLDGVVVADSDVAAGDIGSLENHRGRPEILQALQDGRGESVRHSDTLGLAMLYAALPLKRNNRIDGVVRVARPLNEVEASHAELKHAVGVATLIALATAALLALIAAHLSSRSVRKLTAAASRMAGGDLSTRSHVGGADEIGALGRALDHLASSLSETMEELVTERDKLRAVLDGMRDGVLLLDAEGRVLVVNRAAQQMVPVIDEAEGLPVERAITDPTLAAAIAGAGPAGGAFEHVVSSARNGADDDSESSQESTPRELSVRIEPLENGAVQLVVLYDVTNLRRLESLRTDFVSNASHELRTPIASIRSAAETLTSGALEDAAAGPRFVGIIDRNAQRLQQLVNDLLDLSQIESKRLTLDVAPRPLEPAIAPLVELFSERAKALSIEMTTKLSPDLPDVFFDTGALEQVLSNLLDNALKYGAAGATVCICAGVGTSSCDEAADPDDAQTVSIIVSDSGPGIEPCHLERLFERFYRVDAGRSRQLGGTGLGLSIVKHLVEAMNGSVAVQSAPGKGTKFVIELPALVSESSTSGVHSHDTGIPSYPVANVV